MAKNNRRRRRPRQNSADLPIGDFEYPGIMGWMQRNTKLLFLVGVTFMVLSTFAFAFSSRLGNTAVPVDTPTPTATSTGAATETPEATPTEVPIQRQYSSAPEMQIDASKSYTAIIHLEGGDVEIALLTDEAPEYVNNFVFLAENRFYDGLTFHRVLPGFVAQAGDPLGTGAGGPGYALPEEQNGLAFTAGVLSMAKSAAGVSGSQFFITLGSAPHLNGAFTVFGRVTSGLELLQGLTPRDPQQPDQPSGDVIQSIEIVEE